jgi:hypothetical protein
MVAMKRVLAPPVELKPAVTATIEAPRRRRSIRFHRLRCVASTQSSPDGPKDRCCGTITPNVYAAPRQGEQAVELGIN